MMNVITATILKNFRKKIFPHRFNMSREKQTIYTILFAGRKKKNINIYIYLPQTK